MADFVEVMGIKSRMCKYYDDCSDGCPLDNTNFCALSDESLSERDFKEAETIMLNWSKEHPIVYPTWTEWLSKQGFVELKDGQFVKQTENEYLIECKTVAILTDKAAVPIPAEIAEKLGIKPKEG